MRRVNVSGDPCTFAIFRGCISSAERVFSRRSAWLKCRRTLASAELVTSDGGRHGRLSCMLLLSRRSTRRYAVDFFRGRAMPQTLSRRPLPADLLPRRRGLDPGPVHARFVLNKVAVRQVSLGVLPFFHVNIIPPTLHTHFIICYRRYINLAIAIIVKQHTSNIYSGCKNQKTHA